MRYYSSKFGWRLYQKVEITDFISSSENKLWLRWNMGSVILLESLNIKLRSRFGSKSISNVLIGSKFFINVMSNLIKKIAN
jgi:hypothetical protein